MISAITKDEELYYDKILLQMKKYFKIFFKLIFVSAFCLIWQTRLSVNRIVIITIIPKKKSGV